jgi:dTDP-4-dehydrorhamnose reductase
VKILVIGAEGQVGTFLLRELAAKHQVFGTAMLPGNQLPPMDIRDAQAVTTHLQTVQPDQVILTAAMTHVDLCEEKPDEAHAINVQGTKNVALACQQIKAGMTFFSTDYVFDGNQGPYDENDTPSPQSVYARTKLEGEKIVADTVENHLIVRPMFVFSFLQNSMNFFMQLVKRVNSGEPITVPGDQIGNPTHAVNLARVIGELLEKECRGIYHTVGSTRVGKDELARRIVGKLGGDVETVKSVTTAEFKQKAPRPLNSGLKIDKAQNILTENKLWDLDTALEYTLSQMGND